MHTQSLYNYISTHLTNGQLPHDFSLPKVEGEAKVRFADGAMDGITFYHSAPVQIDEAETELMKKAVGLASGGKVEEADAAFSELGAEFRAISIIDVLQEYIRENTDKLSAENVYRTAMELIQQSGNREAVKFGLCMRELFPRADEATKKVVRTVGLSDEFTIFAVWNMMNWEDGNEEIFGLIRKVRGWGRIHALERLEPETAEIADWILRNGVDNDVMSAYSALTAWEKAGVEKRLGAKPSQEDFEAIGRIVLALLDEGPVTGISEVENADVYLGWYLDLAESYELSDDDLDTVSELQSWAEKRRGSLRRIAGRCKAILEKNDT
ncbi:MAG: hypothetical protein IJM57_08245 [Lachnospiraceae bacterium]|nr:hypothetical protein [Lachnospiraceae bacterium]